MRAFYAGERKTGGLKRERQEGWREKDRRVEEGKTGGLERERQES